MGTNMNEVYKCEQILTLGSVPSLLMLEIPTKGAYFTGIRFVSAAAHSRNRCIVRYLGFNESIKLRAKISQAFARR